MRILITGAFGFIGGRLAKYFAQLGHQIVLGTRHPILAPDWLSQAEIAEMEWDDDRSLELNCKDIDMVIHAAGMNAQDCSSNPTEALAFNGLATERLVSAAARKDVKRFLYLSTAHVYANPLIGSIKEDACPRNLHPYATSHLAGEYAVLRAGQLGKLQGSVLRLSNTFGVPMHKDVNCWMLLVNDLCRQAVETGKLSLQTSGLQQRDFIGLGEVCRIVRRLIVNERLPGHPNIFNVGTGESQSVLAMARMIQRRCTKVLGFKPNIQRIEGKKVGRPSRLTFQTNNLTTLGIYPRTSQNTKEIDNLLKFCKSKFIQMHF